MWYVVHWDYHVDAYNASIAIRIMSVDAYKANIAIRIMSDTRDEEKDRNKDERSKVGCKTP